MARLYANENFPFQVVVALRQFGHDVLTIQETGKGGEAVTDVDVLRFAVADNRAVLTLNRRDFIRLHNLVPAHQGIIVCSVDANAEALARRVHNAIASADLTGSLVRVNRP